MPDALGGFGLAAKIAMDLAPGDGGNPWSKPNGFGAERGGPRQDGDPSMHGFQKSFWGGDRCGYSGCGQPAAAHDEEGQQ